MSGTKENSHHLLSCFKSTLILTFRIIDLQIDRTTLYTPLTIDANPDGKGPEKESDKHIYCKKLLFCFYVLLILWIRTSDCQCKRCNSPASSITVESEGRQMKHC